MTSPTPPNRRIRVVSEGTIFGINRTETETEIASMIINGITDPCDDIFRSRVMEHCRFYGDYDKDRLGLGYTLEESFEDLFYFFHNIAYGTRKGHDHRFLFA